MSFLFLFGVCLFNCFSCQFFVWFVDCSFACVLLLGLYMVFVLFFYFWLYGWFISFCCVGFGWVLYVRWVCCYRLFFPCFLIVAFFF